MHKTVLLLACAAVIGLLGCKKLLQAAADDSADATANASPPPSAPEAPALTAPATKVAFANAADIARYPDEKPIADEKATVHTNMLARTAVPSGAVVATVLSGKPITKLASHQGFVLVSFEDPKDASRTLIGWIAQGGIAAPGATAAAANAAGGPASAKGACPAGQVRFAGFGCKVECPSDDDCKKVPGTECVGGQFVEEPGGTNHVGRACLKSSTLPAQKKCKAGEILAADECALKCDPDAPKCPASKRCDVARFRGETGDFVVEHICQ